MRALLAAIRAALRPSKRRPNPAPLALVADSYRSTPPRRRFELRLEDDAMIDGDTFGEIVELMRARGCSNADIVDAAIVAMDMPQGGVVYTRRGHWPARTGMKVGKRYD